MKLLGKTALVTGAARGIGRGCALELARAGADVAVNDLTRSPEAEAVVAEIRALGRQAVLVEGDVFERPSCESVVARAIEALGRIDILVSNPAFSRRGDFLDYDPAPVREGAEGDALRRLPHEPARRPAHGRARRRREDRLHLQRPRPHPVRPQRGLQRRQERA